MLQQEKRSSNAAPRDAELAEARKWEQEARAAREAGDWARAIVCYRKALQLAPFTIELRDDFEAALEAQIRERLRREKAAGRKPAAVVAAVADEDDEDAAPAARPARPVRRSREAAPSLRDAVPARRTLIAAACLAALLTTGGLFATAVASGWLRDRIAQTDVAAAPEIPAELQQKLDAAALQLKASRRDDAIRTFRDAAKAFPDVADTVVHPQLAAALAEAGEASVKQKRYESALKAWEEATALDAQRGLYWVSYGRTLREYARSGAFSATSAKRAELLKKAEEAFNRALALEPEDSGALYGLAQVYDARKDRQKATETYEKLVALAPDSVEGKLARTSLAELRKR